MNNSIDGGRKYGGVSARAHLDSGRGSRRGTSGAILSSRMSTRERKAEAEAKTLFPWEKREVSLKQNEILGR